MVQKQGVRLTYWYAVEVGVVDACAYDVWDVAACVLVGVEEVEPAVPEGDLVSWT